MANQKLKITLTHGAEEMKKWRDIVEKHCGKSGYELSGLQRGAEGEWVGVFSKIPENSQK